MQGNITLKRAIQSAIVFLALLAILLVWPLNLISGWERVGELDEASLMIFQSEGALSQTFTVEQEDLTYISFYLYNEEPLEEGTLYFRLFDSTGAKLEEREVALSKLNIPGVCRIRVSSELSVGESYYFTLENVDSELLYSMTDGINLDVCYEYRVYFPNVQCILYIFAVLAIGIVLYLLTAVVLRKNTVSVRYDVGIRYTLAVLVVGSSLWALINVFPLRKFTTDWVNILFFEVGILLFMGYSLYGLLYKRADSDMDFSIKCMLPKLPSVVQSFAFAGVIAGCCDYVNTLYEYQHKLAINMVLCCFAIAIISTYKRKEIINWYNIVWSLIAILGGIYYFRQYKDNVEQYAIAKGTAIAVLFWGIVLWNTIRILLQRKRNKINILYIILLIVLVAEMVRSRNTRTWPIDIAIFWGLFAIRVIYKGKVPQYISSFTNGVFIHFVYISIYAMLYRPFHFFTHTRYPGAFHTVTMAAVYYALVLTLAIGSFLTMYRKRKRLREVWKEIGLIGFSSGFLILTVSRTGIFAAIIVCVLLLVVTTFTEFRDGLVGIFKRVCIMCVTGIAFFTITFSFCRMIPAVVSKPYIYDIEWFKESIKSGEEWDSRRFMTIQRFLVVMDAKLSYYVEDSTDSADMEGITDLTVESTESAIGPDTKQANVITEEKESLGANTDYSNGRLDIYKMYLKQLNWTGHDSINIDYVEEGITKATGHAHNSFIQVAYDFGLGAGIYFILFCLYVGLYGIMYYLRNREDSTAILPVTIIGTFGICGMVEWVFIPYIPIGFAFLLILVLLIPASQEG